MIDKNTKYWNNDTIHAYAKKHAHLNDKSSTNNSKTQTNRRAYEILYNFTDTTYNQVIKKCNDTIKFYNQLLNSKDISVADHQVIQKFIKYTHRLKNALLTQNEKAIQTNLLKINNINITNNSSNIPTSIKESIHNYIVTLNNLYVDQAKKPLLHHIDSNFVKSNKLSHLVYTIATTLDMLYPLQCTEVQLTQKYYDIYAHYKHIRSHAYDNILKAIMSHNKAQLINGIQDYNQNSLTFQFTTGKIQPTKTKFTQMFQLIKNIVTQEAEDDIQWSEVYNKIDILPSNLIQLASKPVQKEWKAFCENIIKKDKAKQNAKLAQQFKNDTKSLKNQFAKINQIKA